MKKYECRMEKRGKSGKRKAENLPTAIRQHFGRRENRTGTNLVRGRGEKALLDA
jgi:hypothetical protein